MFIIDRRLRMEKGCNGKLHWFSYTAFKVIFFFFQYERDKHVYLNGKPKYVKKFWRFLHRLSVMRWLNWKEGAELNWSISPIVPAAIDLGQTWITKPFWVHFIGYKHPYQARKLGADDSPPTWIGLRIKISVLDF